MFVYLAMEKIGQLQPPPSLIVILTKGDVQVLVGQLLLGPDQLIEQEYGVLGLDSATQFERGLRYRLRLIRHCNQEKTFRLEWVSKLPSTAIFLIA